MPLRDFICLDCGHQSYDELVRHGENDPNCPHCESTRFERLPSAHGGYKFDSGSASVRPKSAGSFKKSKAGRS